MNIRKKFKEKNITLDLNLYNSNKEIKTFYYMNDLKKSLKKHNLSIKGNKKDLETRLFNYFEKLNSYDKYIEYILLLQRNIKKYLLKKKIKTQGIGIINKSKCNNQEDFYTLDSIDEIEDKYFFSYEENNNIYFFDIRSFSKLLKNDTKNPYTRLLIPKYVIHSYNLRMKDLIKKKINIEDIKQPKLTKEQIFNNKVTTIFQKIDLLNIYAGGSDTNWFLNLNIIELKMFYKVLEDIWNYRAELTPQKKFEIVQNNIMFTISVNEIYYFNNKRKIQELILNEIDKLVSSSNNDEDKKTGGYFVLTALVEISPECSESLPWLIQIH